MEITRDGTLAGTDFIHSANSDVYLGYLGWSAGSFDSTYSKNFKVPS